jgi:hypothetical protein
MLTINNNINNIKDLVTPNISACRKIDMGDFKVGVNTGV